MITEAKFAQVAQVPVSMPETSLDPGGYVVVGSVYVPVRSRMCLSYLSLAPTRCIEFRPTGRRLSDAYGTIYAGLFYGDKPTSPLICVDADLGEMKCSNSRDGHEFCVPGLYSIIVVNNLEACSVSACVTASIVLFDADVLYSAQQATSATVPYAAIVPPALAITSMEVLP